MVCTWLGISPDLRQFQLTADCVATVAGNPALYAFGAIVAKTHATTVDCMYLRVCVQVSDACDERS